jgi:hypothetical protein
MFSGKVPLQFGTIALSANASWLFDVWIENLARTQLYRNEMMTFTPPNTFDIPGFKAKMLAFLKELNLDPARYEKNIKIFISESTHHRAMDKNVMQIPFDANMSIDEASVIAFVEKFSSLLNTWMKEGGFKHQINLGILQAYVSRFRDASVARIAIDNMVQRFSMLQNATFIILTFLDDPYNIELQKVSSFFFEMTFLHGTPIINVIAPQIPSLYGLLMSPPKEPGKKNFVLYPIV